MFKAKNPYNKPRTAPTFGSSLRSPFAMIQQDSQTSNQQRRSTRGTRPLTGRKKLWAWMRPARRPEGRLLATSRPQSQLGFRRPLSGSPERGCLGRARTADARAGPKSPASLGRPGWQCRQQVLIREKDKYLALEASPPLAGLITANRLSTT